MILNGDSLDVLKTLGDNSVDSVVTDPPYGLSFMGKSWDYDVPQVELWQEVFRVLKPGGHLLSFAGSRTYHRMAVNIEDAGFEIRDQIMWVYGSGFPKSLNIGKAVDKLQGNEGEWVKHPKYANRNGSGVDSIFGQTDGRTGIRHIYKGNSPYEGWGTALKPSHEPIVVARKPISEKNIAENVLRWNTGGINIDASRVPTDEDISGVSSSSSIWSADGTAKNVKSDGRELGGRFPANFIHDGSDEVVGLFPNVKGEIGRPNRKSGGDYNATSYKVGAVTENGLKDSGSAARFFYCAKASKSERNKGLEGFEKQTTDDGRKKSIDNAFQRGETERHNNHPTVKPVRLMQYLVRLVTPPQGTVLDPFNGSGTTGIACKLEGFDYIGIEREAEYVEISKARIEAWEVETSNQLELV